MSEELYGEGTVDERVGQTPTAPATGDAADRQPETATGQTPGRTLTEEEFRKYQVNFDRRYEQARQEAVQARQEAQRYQQQLGQFQQQWEAQQMQALPDEQKPLFENQRLRQQLQQMQNQMQQVNMQNLKQQAMLALKDRAAAKGVDVTLDELAQHQNADDAWDYILDKGLKGVGQRQAQRQEKRDANSVDLGGGAPVTNTSDYQTRYDRALKRSDAKAMLDIMYEAASQNVELNI